jgi:hypothetical protein
MQEKEIDRNKKDKRLAGSLSLSLVPLSLWLCLSSLSFLSHASVSHRRLRPYVISRLVDTRHSHLRDALWQDPIQGNSIKTRQGEGFSSGCHCYALCICVCHVYMLSLSHSLSSLTPLQGKDTEDTWRNITKGNLQFPDTPAVSADVKNLIKKLLHNDAKKRLGNEQRMR